MVRTADNRRSNYGKTSASRQHSTNGKSIIPPRKLQCYSVACNDMSELEFGDKIVLPSSVLLELQCFKISPPMLFHIRAYGVQNSSSNSNTLVNAALVQQYCSVQEFSAPDGLAFLPYWMMQNLCISEGQNILLSHISTDTIPRGIYCRLQPEQLSFIDLAAEIGPKLLMESAFRRYSVLSVDETIVIEYGTQHFYVRVVELKPSTVVSLLGNVDLEMDFMAPTNSRTRESVESTIDSTVIQKPQLPLVTTHTPSEAPCLVGCGRRLSDGGYVLDDATIVGSGTGKETRVMVGTSSFQTAQRRRLSQSASGEPPPIVVTAVVAERTESSVLAKDVRLAESAFATIGHRLGGATETTSQSNIPNSISTFETTPLVNKECTICPHCCAEVIPSNLDLHTMRCVKHPAYHRIICTICHIKILKIHQDQHIHCPSCSVVLSSEMELGSHTDKVHAASHKCQTCTAYFTASGLEVHQRDICPHALEVCSLCGFQFKHKDMSRHITMCASRTEQCEKCLKYIKIIDLESHTTSCVDDQPVQPPQTSLLECVYCTKKGFPDQLRLERHVSQDCLIARSFSAPLLSKSMNIGAKATATTTPPLIQGKVKRKGDLYAISESSRASFQGLVGAASGRSHNNQEERQKEIFNHSSIVHKQVPLRRQAKLYPQGKQSPSTASIKLEALAISNSVNYQQRSEQINAINRPTQLDSHRTPSIITRGQRTLGSRNSEGEI